jgi:DnaJ-class molecular chaperone
MKNIRTHYDNLKVARNAPPEVIRAAYKTLSQKHHPDRNGNSAESQRVMKIINESYAVLSDPQARRRHDAWIIEQESPESSEVKTQRPTRENEFPPPVSGEVNFYELDEETKKRIKDRASGVNKDQIRIKVSAAKSTLVPYVY